MLDIALFGAVGDGNSHPLSEFFSSLLEAQFTYPDATSLFEEVDWHATNKAMKRAVLAVGGTVTGTGHFIMNNVNAPNTGIVLPECRLANYGFTPKGTQINIEGAGVALTTFDWPAEPTALRFALSCGDPTATAANGLGRYATSGPAPQYDARVSKLTLRGPWAGQAETSYLGVVPGVFEGFAWGDRLQVSDVDIVGFYNGLNTVGGQALLTNVRAYRCYHSLYMDAPNTANFGDINYRGCKFNAARRAAVGINVDATLVGVKFETSYLGAAPYVFWKEAGTGTVSGWQTMLNNVCADSCQFEFVGNALMGEGNATKIGQVYQSTFNHCFFSWSSSYKIAAEPRRAMVDIARLENFRWHGILEGQNWTPGDDATFRITSAAGVELEGNIQKILDAAEGAGKPFLHSSATTPSDRRFTLNDVLGWRGHFAYLFNVGTLHDVSAKYGAGALGAQKGAVLCWGGGNPATQAKLMEVTDERPLVGIAAVSSPHSNYVAVISDTQASVAFAVQGTDVVNSGNPMKVAAAGYVTQAVTSVDGRIIGYAQANATGTSPARTVSGFLA